MPHKVCTIGVINMPLNNIKNQEQIASMLFCLLNNLTVSNKDDKLNLKIKSYSASKLYGDGGYLA